MRQSAEKVAAILAVDIGATKIALGVVLSNLAIKSKEEFYIGEFSSDELWEQIAKTALTLVELDNLSINGVGIASAGPIDVASGTISPVNIKVWRNFPIVEKFKSIFNEVPIILIGDATALAYAENKVGAGFGKENMLGVVVSTGVGGGLILNNSLVLGDSGNAGFIGHQTINFEGKECSCGRKDCVEIYASGPNMVTVARSRGWNKGSNFAELAESARQGDEIAIDAIRQGARALAKSIVNTVGALDINTVVIGGGVSLAGDIYWNPLLEEIKDEAKYQNFLKDLEIMPAKLQRDAGLIGASLAISDYGVIYE